jgi:hypothetical protein
MKRRSGGKKTLPVNKVTETIPETNVIVPSSDPLFPLSDKKKDISGRSGKTVSSIGDPVDIFEQIWMIQNQDETKKDVLPTRLSSKEDIENDEDVDFEDEVGLTLEFVAKPSSFLGSSGDMFFDDEIEFSELELGERIGVGGFAEVFKAEWRGTEVAVKRLLLPKATDDAVTEFIAEVNLLRRLRHPNIVMFMGACTKSPNLCLVTELLQMSLFDLLHNTKIKLSWKIKLKIAQEAAMGMNYLHRHRPTIIHRDLKSANLLVRPLDSVKAN